MRTYGLRLLVVDDSESMRRVIRGVLTRLGLDNVDEAHDGAAGLAMFLAANYDLVVTDLSMPNMNGLELLRAIRAVPGSGRVPVVMVSGQLTEKNIREAVAAGVDGFVAKPFVEGPLIERVSRLLTNPPRRALETETGPARAQLGALEGAVHGSGQA